jgi:ribose transport system substrate-binding protein
MKKSTLVRTIALAVVVLLSVVAFAGCSSQTPAPSASASEAPSQSAAAEVSSAAPASEAAASESAAAGDQPWAGKRLGIAHISIYDEWCKAVYDEFMSQAKELGFGEVNIQDGNLNAETQQKQVEDFITQKYDMILIDPVSSDGIVPTLQKAGDAGIPVIAFDSGSSYDKLITHVAWNHGQSGVLTADYVADYATKNLGGKVKVGILAMLNAPHTAIRSEEFKKELEAKLGKENVEYVFDQDFGETRESATNIVTNNIAKPVDIIWAAVDNAAFGAKVALETNNIKDTKIVSAGAWGKEPFTALNNNDPYYMMCIGVSPKEIVKMTLDNACKVFEGKGDTLEKEQEIELSVIDSSNIADYMKYVQE